MAEEVHALIGQAQLSSWCHNAIVYMNVHIYSLVECNQ